MVSLEGATMCGDTVVATAADPAQMTVICEQLAQKRIEFAAHLELVAIVKTHEAAVAAIDDEIAARNAEIAALTTEVDTLKHNRVPKYKQYRRHMARASAASNMFTTEKEKLAADLKAQQFTCGQCSATYAYAVQHHTCTWPIVLPDRTARMKCGTVCVDIPQLLAHQQSCETCSKK